MEFKFFIAEKTNQAMNSKTENDKSKGVEGKRRGEKGRGGGKKEDLEVGIACHLLLGLESLVKAKEDIFLVTIGPPISTCLDQERIRSQAVEISGCTSSK